MNPEIKVRITTVEPRQVVLTLYGDEYALTGEEAEKLSLQLKHAARHLLFVGYNGKSLTKRQIALRNSSKDPTHER